MAHTRRKLLSFIVFLIIASTVLAVKIQSGPNYGFSGNEDSGDPDELTVFDSDTIGAIDETVAEINSDFESSTSGTAGIQFMITQRMRRILEVELGYLPSEVNAMEPQIAAVVIERGLARPSKGMPSSWRRADHTTLENRGLAGNSSNRFERKLFKRVVQFTTSVFDSMKEKAAPILPILIPIAASVCSLQIIRMVMENGGFDALKALFNQSNIKRNKNKNAALEGEKDSQKLRRKVGRKGLIDLSSLEKVQDEDIFDHVKLNFDVLRHKYI